MEESKRNIDIEYELADVITAQPHEFTVGRKHYRLYPVTLAKTFILGAYMKALEINRENLYISPSLETLRVVYANKSVCCSILAIHTAPNTYRDLFCMKSRKDRANVFMRMSNEDLASLMMAVLTSDKTDLLMQELGISREQERMRKAMAVKKKNGSLNFGAVTVFGTFIVPLKEMGYTDNEILYEKSYTFLRLMLADKLTSVLMSDDEMQNLHVEDGGTLIDGNNPESAGDLRKFAEKHGIEIKDY